MRRVIIESPYTGDIDRNTTYARRAVADSLARDEAPLASHLLYTQAGILDDDNPDDRKKGINAGLAWGPAADATVVYIDYGFTDGMHEGMARARAEGRPIEFRHIGDNQ